MSALPPKADMCAAQAHVCFGPKADIDAISDWLHSVFDDTKRRQPLQGFGPVCPC